MSALAAHVGPYEYLSVDAYLKTLMDARALKTAFELGLIDRLVEPRGGALEALGPALGVDRQGLRLLIELLKANSVVEAQGGDIRLTRGFAAALRFRDLMETKLDLAGFLLTDFADLFTSLVKSASAFSGSSRLFQLFDYRRALAFSPENYAATRGWMRVTTTLSRYEAQAALDLYDFSRHRRVLDVGGNSGEFLRQLRRRHPHLEASVFDLPLVCEIGLEQRLADGEPVGFVKGDLRRDPLPEGYDLIVFKSMLHDWPAQEARGFLDKAARALRPGGALVVFERGPLEIETTPPVSLLPVMLFFRSYRHALDYLSHFQALGMQDVGVRYVTLDSPFFLASAVKPGG